MDFALPDIRTLSEAGVPVALLAPTGMPLKTAKGEPVTITVIGPDSDRYRELMRAQTRQRIQRASAGQAQPSFAEEEAEIIGLLVECTTGWSGVEAPDGKPIPCTVEAVNELYRRFPYIRDQIDRAIGDRARFIKAS